MTYIRDSILLWVLTQSPIQITSNYYSQNHIPIRLELRWQCLLSASDAICVQRIRVQRCIQKYNHFDSVLILSFVSSIYRSFIIHTHTRYSNEKWLYFSLQLALPVLSRVNETQNVYREKHAFYPLCVMCVCRDFCVSLCVYVRLLLWSKGTHCACNIYTVNTPHTQHSSSPVVSLWATVVRSTSIQVVYFSVEIFYSMKRKEIE